MAKDYNNLAEQIIAALGGKENIKNCFHCATRLRFQLEDSCLLYTSPSPRDRV